MCRTTTTGHGGTPVRGWLHVPAGVTDPLPTVVEYHGYSRGRGYAHFSTIWAQAGWAPLQHGHPGQGWHGGGGSATDDVSADAGGFMRRVFLTAGIAGRDTFTTAGSMPMRS